MANVIENIEAKRKMAQVAIERADDCYNTAYWRGYADGLNMAKAIVWEAARRATDALAVSDVVIDGLLADVRNGGA